MHPRGERLTASRHQPRGRAACRTGGHTEHTSPTRTPRVTLPSTPPMNASSEELLSSAARCSRVRRTHAYASQPRCADRASAVLASLLRELLLLRHRGGPCLELLPAALHASCARRGSRGEGLERICEIGRIGIVELGWISREVCLCVMLSGSADVARGGGGLSGAVVGFPNSRVSSPRRPLPWAG